MAIQFTANLTGYTYHYYPIPDQSQYQQPYWKLFDSFAWADYTVDFFFKNTPGTDNYVEGNYGTFPMLTNYKNNDAEDPRNTCGLLRWDNTNIFVQSGIPHAGFGYGALGLGDNKQYKLRINKFDSFTSYDSLTDLEVDTTTSWYSTADEAHSSGTLELFSYSIGLQFQGLDFYDLNGTLVKSFRPYRYDNQDYLYESVEDKYYGPDGSSPTSTLPGSDVQPDNVVTRPSKLLLSRRRLLLAVPSLGPAITTWTGRYYQTNGDFAVFSPEFSSPVTVSSISYEYGEVGGQGNPLMSSYASFSGYRYKSADNGWWYRWDGYSTFRATQISATWHLERLSTNRNNWVDILFTATA